MNAFMAIFHNLVLTGSNQHCAFLFIPPHQLWQLKTSSDVPVGFTEAEDVFIFSPLWRDSVCVPSKSTSSDRSALCLHKCIPYSLFQSNMIYWDHPWITYILADNTQRECSNSRFSFHHSTFTLSIADAANI